MKPALLLIDLQHDFLAAPALQPAAPMIVSAAAALLLACRAAQIPVLHILTTVQRQPDNRMPHWNRAAADSRGAAPEAIQPLNAPTGKWICEAGTPGHQPPPEVAPIAGEPVIHKQFFSGFRTGHLDERLRAIGCDTLLIAGVHTHGCVRATAFDAYERSYQVLVAADAVGSDDPVHAAITRRYLEQRCTRFLPVSALIPLLSKARDPAPPPADDVPRSWQHHPPADLEAPSWETPLADAAEVTRACTALARAWQSRPPTTLAHRAAPLRQLAADLATHQAAFAQDIRRDVGKPIRMARGEVQRSIELLHAVADQAAQPLEAATAPNARWRRVPLGVIALMTPWNNPLAIPIGKIAPALLYDNAVLWKPALPGSRIARRLADLWQPHSAGLLTLLTGDHHAAGFIADHADIDAVSLSGSLQAGYALQERCARRHIPFQGEMGGNNAAIIAEDADLPAACAQVAAGAFGFAGQRCTANRRLIVPAARLDEALTALTNATRALPWGNPAHDATAVGPLIDRDKCAQVRAAIERAQTAGLTVLVPHALQANAPALLARGTYLPPTIIVATDPNQEWVQEEFFAPLLVVQPANSFAHALTLCNGVRQGLVAALFSHSQTCQAQFLAEACAGVLKLNSTTADADPVSPLGGWKASGVGPPEHGPGDREFFTRLQTLYTQ